MIRYVNVTSVKERGLVNESLGTMAVIQAHVFLARKEEAHSGKVTLWTAMAAILGTPGHSGEGGERGFLRGFPLPTATNLSSNRTRRQGHMLSPVKKGQGWLWARRVPWAHPGPPVCTTGSSAFLHERAGGHVQTRGVRRKDGASLLESLVRSEESFARSPLADSSPRTGSHDSLTQTLRVTRITSASAPLLARGR